MGRKISLDWCPSSLRTVQAYAVLQQKFSLSLSLSLSLSAYVHCRSDRRWRVALLRFTAYRVFIKTTADTQDTTAQSEERKLVMLHACVGSVERRDKPLSVQSALTTGIATLGGRVHG